MGWRDGCAERPPVHADATPVAFDFGAADAVGQCLDGLRRAVAAAVDARASASTHLVEWVGRHRRDFDAHRHAQEAVLTGADLAGQIAHLRAAWDDAAAAQVRANRQAAEAVADGARRLR